jgi:putative DNA primase/helicase
LGNAERLVRLFGDRIRFVPQWGWLVWDGERWARDNGNQRITELAEETVRQIYREAAEAQDPEERAKLAKWAIASESRQRITALIDLAAPMCLASPDEFDADDWLLNLENGVLNLRTLEFLPHDPNLKLTPTLIARSGKRSFSVSSTTTSASSASSSVLSDTA